MSFYVDLLFKNLSLTSRVKPLSFFWYENFKNTCFLFGVFKEKYTKIKEPVLVMRKTEEGRYLFRLIDVAVRV